MTPVLAVDLNCTDVAGKTALHWAVIGHNAPGGRLLLADHRFNKANHRDSVGMTPVLAAVITGNMDVLLALVAHQSVDLDSRDLRGKSLEERARARKFAVGERIVRVARQERARQEERHQGATGQNALTVTAAAPSVPSSSTSSTLAEVEELKKKQEETVQATIKEYEESEQRALRENEERMKVVSRENQRRVEKQTIENKKIIRELKQKNEENLTRLLSNNEAQLAEMMAKQEEQGKKRRADQMETVASENQPAAPECPVCLEKMVPPTKIFHCVKGHHPCETCKLKMNQPLCPSCRKVFIGRAFGMENFLQDLSKASTSSQ